MDPAYREHSLHHMIEVAAYYRAQRRNFAQGHELEDWLEAEKSINHDLQEPKVNGARV